MNYTHRPTAVMVSNPVRLHAHRLAYALQEAGLLQGFYTSIWAKPGVPPAALRALMPRRLARAIGDFLAKRSHPGLKLELVHQFPVAEIVRLSLDLLTQGKFHEWLMFYQKQTHDCAMARAIWRERPAVFVGYEISCRRSFAAARALGCVTVLDLAGLDHRFVTEQRQRLLGVKGPSAVERALARQKLAELELADHILCVSEFARRVLIAAGVGADRIDVVSLGTDLSVFKPKAVYRTSGPLEVLYVGNLSRAKGVDRLLSAITSLGRDDIHLTLVGSLGDLDPATELTAPWCRHVPYLQHDELARRYAAADVFVLPSLYDSWGMVVAEAMACGTPAIVSTNAGARELAQGIGWVVPAGDVPRLAAAIAEAADDRTCLEERGERSAAALREMSWASYEGQIAAIFARILDDAPHAPLMV